MTTLFLALLGKFWPVIVAALGALAWGWRRERVGVEKERAKQAAAEKKARDVADDVQNDVGALTPEQRRKALRKWSR